jgi:putative flippase GtrA
LKSWKEFLRFGLVGVIGFAVDASTLAMMLMADAGVLRGRAVSYVAAASCTWALNRRWTFMTEAAAARVNGHSFWP